MSNAPDPETRNPESNKAFLLFAVVFVAILFVIVAMKGGDHFYSRVQRLDTIRISIQSDDPARELMDDPEKEIALIETFLLPSPDRRKRAEEMYTAWRANKDWSVAFGKTNFIEAQNTAIVERSLQWTRPGTLRLYGEKSNWQKQDGIWYLVKSEEFLLKEEPDNPNQPVLP
ncbi:MAG: hypothetical protein IT367_00250 [Candidatus Hydrogenedentes bacterium]|nr:hypothetical protein [Candidatus Hydrogenedentota bacterium]